MVAHGVLVVGWLFASSIATQHGPARVTDGARFLYPLFRNAPKPAQEHLQFIGLHANTQSSGPPQQSEPSRDDKKTPVEVPPESPREVAQTPDRPMSELEVDSTALRDPESVGPVYPPAMLAQNIEGQAFVRYVVGSDGTVDPRSVLVIATNDSAFSDAARDALPKMRFRPAYLRGQAVSQLVQQIFSFRIAVPTGKPTR